MNYFAILSLMITATLIHSCCESDCDQTDYSANISILSKADSTDLFFGQDPMYQVDKTKYFGLSGGDTIYLFHYNLVILLDTVLFVDFGSVIDTAYIQYEDGDLDTLQVFRRTNYSKCCGSATHIDQIGLNKAPLVDNSFPFITLYK